MSANENEYLTEEESAKNLRELASTMENDVTHLRELAQQFEDGEKTVAEADRNGDFNLETDEFV